MKALTTALCTLALAATPAMADKTTFDLSLPLSLLSGDDGRITLECNDSRDGDTREMMRALSRRSRSSWQSEGNDGRVSASRRGAKFRLRAWSEGTKAFDVRMPWRVAECLFGGRGGQTVEVDTDDIQADGGFRMLLSGETAQLGLTVD